MTSAELPLNLPAAAEVPAHGVHPVRSEDSHDGIWHPAAKVGTACLEHC